MGEASALAARDVVASLSTWYFPNQLLEGVGGALSDREECVDSSHPCQTPLWHLQPEPPDTLDHTLKDHVDSSHHGDRNLNRTP